MYIKNRRDSRFFKGCSPLQPSCNLTGSSTASGSVSGIYIARLVIPPMAGQKAPEYTKSIKACPEFGEGCCC